MIAGLTILTSCGNKSSEKSEDGILESTFSSNDAPKCEDEEVKKTVISSLVENRENIYTERGSSVSFFLTGKGKLKNIMTKSVDKEIKLCNCEGTYIEENEFEGNVTYSAQKNSEVDVIIQIENAGPMNFID